MRYGVKAVFSVRTRFRNPQRAPVMIYETRILNINAGNKAEARRLAKKFLSKDTWSCAPVAYILSQEQKFLGIMDLEDLRILDDREVWYEYSDDDPRVRQANAVQARRKRLRRRARSR